MEIQDCLVKQASQAKQGCLENLYVLQPLFLHNSITKKDSLWTTYIFVTLAIVRPQRIFACFYADTN